MTTNMFCTPQLEQIKITPVALDRLRLMALPYETLGETVGRVTNEALMAYGALDELRGRAEPGETDWDTLMRMLDDYSAFHDRLRPFARPGETVGQTFDRLMDGLKSFLRGLAGV